MLILIDLDGTITNTVHPSWKPYKDGIMDYPTDKIPYIEGSIEFIKRQQQQGNCVLIVSDSHPRYVIPISKYLGIDCVSLADKPNNNKLSLYMVSHPDYERMVKSKDCILIGDTVLDIELGRRLEIPTIWISPYLITDEIKDAKDKIGDDMTSIKMGPTYVAKTFAEIDKILDEPINNLYTIESIFAGGISSKAIKYSINRFRDGSYAAIRCLARQEASSCDQYARSDKYHAMSNSNRSQDLLKALAKGISTYIQQPSLQNEGWDYITYLTDKKTTIPQNKMKEVFDLVETDIPKVQLLKWINTINDSIRNQHFYRDRKVFLEQFLYVDAANLDNENPKPEDVNKTCIKDKNIIVLDDQLTTSATAWHVIHQLKNKGAKNILFIALFQMILPVESCMLCPCCGKPMQIKIRYRDGCKFYSCVPPRFGGDGCGYSIKISEQ